jgi:hypothetical protein
MSWVERLTGVREGSAEQVREALEVVGTRLRNRRDGRSWECGTLEVPSLGELRQRVATLPSHGRTTLRERVGDSRALHAEPAHAGATFQVASQFNLLEMVSPDITPERGLGGYEFDRTQGPACALAAGAGTIQRHYFAPFPEGVGQTESRQLDALADLGAALGNDAERHFTMRNGYALPRPGGLAAIAARLAARDEAGRDALRAMLRIGAQWRTEVTHAGAGHLVTQAYCSALPIAYADEPAAAWEPFARLVLEASYEATLCVARLAAAEGGSSTLLLTLVGGGAFGNPASWIVDAIDRALRLHADAGLDVAIVSYGAANPALRPLLAAHRSG